MKPLPTIAWFSYFPVEWLPDAPEEVRQLPRANVIHIHCRIELMSVIDLEDVHLAHDDFVQPPITHVIQKFQRPFAEARRRQIRRHRLPACAEITGIEEMFRVANLIRESSRALCARMCLIHMYV